MLRECTVLKQSNPYTLHLIIKQSYGNRVESSSQAKSLADVLDSIRNIHSNRIIRKQMGALSFWLLASQMCIAHLSHVIRAK